MYEKKIPLNLNCGLDLIGEVLYGKFVCSGLSMRDINAQANCNAKLLMLHEEF